MPALYRCALLSLVLAVPVGAEHEPFPDLAGPSLRFERLDGLSHNTVLSLLQDRHGFLWIGTADGLNRYDGYAPAIYRHDPRDPTSLSNNTIRALAEDSTGTLWVGTDHGVNRFERSSQRFVRYPLGPRAQRRMRVASLTLDEAGRLWGRSFEDPAGVYRFDTEAEAFVRYAIPTLHRPADDSEAFVRASVAAHGTLWVLVEGTERTTLFRYDAGDDRFEPVTPAGRPLPRGAVEPGRTALWATDGAALGRLDLAAQRFDSILRLPADRPPRRLVETRDGALWAGTDYGLYRADPAAGAAHFHPVDSTGTAALSNHVLTLIEDRAGTLWIGTRSGLFRHDPNEKPFVHLGAAEGLPRHAGGRTIMALHEDRSGALWIGTLGGGLVRLDRGTGSVRVYRHTPDDDRSLPDDRLWALHPGPGGRLWLGTEAGLSVLDPRTGRFEARPLPRTRVATYPEGTPAIYTLAPGRDGLLWAAGPWDVSLFDPDNGEVVRHLALGPRLGFAVVQALHAGAASPGTLWIGTENAGLLRYDTASGALTRYPTSAHDSTGLPGETVWTIHEDARGRLWLGTDLGLVRFDPRAETFESFYDPTAYPGALVYSLLEDEGGRLWMGTSQGLARFDPASGTLRHYDRSDGVGNGEFNRRAALRTGDGTFFFGGLDGLTAFRPEAIRDNPFAPPVAITRVDVFEGQGARALYPEDGASLRLGHRENTFELVFAALSFTDPHKNHYAYRLDGFDEGWIEAGTTRRARYTHVPPGPYVFRVRAANNDGLWNEAGAALHLTVAPPVWQTWWFRLLALAAGAALAGAAYRVRVRHLLAVERLRLRIAADLHDDIGSQLSSIALMSEMVRDRTALPEPERAELTRIGAVARQLVDALRDIVWFVAPEHDRPGALVERMREAAARLLAETRHTFDAPRSLALATADASVRHNVFQIYQEALHNAARHAHARTVAITVGERAGTFHLTIADDGAGFCPETVEAGRGLANMRRRAAQIGAELEIISQPGTGTTVQLRLPNDGLRLPNNVSA